MRAFLNLLLVGLLFLSTLGFVFNRVTDSKFIASQARETNLYGRLTTQIETTLPEQFTKNSGLTGEDLSTIVRDSIDADTFYTTLEGYLKSQIDWLTSKEDNNNFSFNLAPIKESAVERITQKQVIEYNKLPICTAEQARLWSVEKGLPECRLNSSDDNIEQALRASTEEGLSELPATLSTPSPSEEMQRTRNVVTKAGQITLIVWLLTIGLIALYILLLRQRAFFPLATTFILVGLLQVGFSLIAWDWLGRIVTESFQNQEGFGELIPLVVDVATTVLNVLKRSLGNISIITLSIGVLFLVLGIVSAIHRPKKKENPA